MQAPTEINLEEDENDLTSFNAFNAREKGAFKDEYRDPRVNERVRMNQFMIMSAYNPYGVRYSMYGNQPIQFHGMNNRFYAGTGFMGPYGYGFSSGFGMEMYNSGYYNSYYGGYGSYYPYRSSYYGYGNPYYSPYYNGGGYYGGNYYGSQYQYTPPTPGNVYYGNRSNLSSSSNRSSSYEGTYNKSAVQTTNSPNGYNVNDQTLGTSRRDVQKRYAGSGDYSNNGKPNSGTYKPTGTGGTANTGSAQQRAVNKSYAPNNSARRSGAVQEQRSVNTSGSSSRTASPSSSPRSTAPQARPQVRSTFSVGGSVGGSTRGTSTPSSTRSTGTSGSSGTTNSGRR